MALIILATKQRELGNNSRATENYSIWLSPSPIIIFHTPKSGQDNGANTTTIETPVEHNSHGKERERESKWKLIKFQWNPQTNIVFL